MGYTVTKMTVNKAVLILENRIKCHKQEKEEAKQMAIKALKQKPCPYSTKDGYCQHNDIAETIPTDQEPSGDLISRIKHAIYKVCLSEGNKDIFVKILDEINKLPSVKQEPKTGHWIEHPTEEDYSVCSRCGIGSRRMEHGKNADGTKYIDIYSYRFCPYCGARMVEPQESEDKE